MRETARLSLLGFSQPLLGPVYDGVGRVLCGVGVGSVWVQHLFAGAHTECESQHCVANAWLHAKSISDAHTKRVHARAPTIVRVALQLLLE
jgi:hypothetical protein